jgi:hypothetical protein
MNFIEENWPWFAVGLLALVAFDIVDDAVAGLIFVVTGLAAFL